jgi:hypothetical protein
MAIWSSYKTQAKLNMRMPAKDVQQQSQSLDALCDLFSVVDRS